MPLLTRTPTQLRRSESVCIVVSGDELRIVADWIVWKRPLVHGTTQQLVVHEREKKVEIANQVVYFVGRRVWRRLVEAIARTSLAR